MMWKPVIPAVSASGCTEKSSGVRNLWLWVHAGAFEEAYGMLKDIRLPLDDRMKEDKVICYSRKGNLGQIDLIGEGSLAVLKKVLFPVCRDHQGKVVKVQQMDEVLNTEQKGNAVVYLEVADPRLKENERCLALEPVCVSPVAVFDDRGSKSKNFMDGRDKRAEAEVMHKEETCNIICSRDSGDFCYRNSKCIDALWTFDANTSKQIFQQPVREKFLSRMRYIDRLDAFGLTKTIKSNRMLERRKNLWQRFTCPIILLKHEHERASGSGWSIIVPMSWIVAFWVPLIFAGGHVIGVRERHWLCTDAGCPTFPDDFPDCKSYAEMKIDSELHDVFVKVDNRKKPLPEEVYGSAQDKAVKGQLLEQKDVVQGLLPHSPSDSGETAAPEYNFFVARTADQLVSFLKMTHQIGLLIFPLRRQPLEKFKGLGSYLHRGTVVWRPKPSNFSASTTAAAKPICLLRVCLRPFCRGVAKVGAKVYAPTPDDYITWSGKEKTSKESVSEVHGRATAVGYVTSMAPRGSKVSSAIAFCDAVALGLARQHQWVNTTWDKNNEIFLMFSNNGSTVFRPSFGSICIEAGPDI